MAKIWHTALSMFTGQQQKNLRWEDIFPRWFPSLCIKATKQNQTTCYTSEKPSKNSWRDREKPQPGLRKPCAATARTSITSTDAPALTRSCCDAFPKSSTTTSLPTSRKIYKKKCEGTPHRAPFFRRRFSSIKCPKKQRKHISKAYKSHREWGKWNNLYNSAKGCTSQGRKGSNKDALTLQARQTISLYHRNITHPKRDKI